MKLAKIDWKKYIERRNSIFYVSIFNTAYGSLLLEKTGFGFKHQLYVCKDGVYTFYKSGKELKKSNKYYLDLIKKKDPRIKEWHKKALECLKKEQELIELFSSNINIDYIINNYDKLINELQNIFLYLTTIPFMILHAVDSSEENFEDTVESFLPFRKRSRRLMQTHILEKLWNVAGSEFGRDYKDLSLFTVDELRNLFNNKDYPNKEEIEKRKNFCVFYNKDAKLYFNYNNNILESLPKENLSAKEVKGTVAYQGKTQGRVKIVNLEQDMGKVEKEDIIVSVNTTPSLMPVLTKCKAIVTDEGGLTCHASVLSRELGIPCVVGTKYATKIFKDGDLIEVDADKGIVRKIK
jgi:phosphohistidine swiveling domain-containing protein